MSALARRLAAIEARIPTGADPKVIGARQRLADEGLDLATLTDNELLSLGAIAANWSPVLGPAVSFDLLRAAIGR